MTYDFDWALKENYLLTYSTCPYLCSSVLVRTNKSSSCSYLCSSVLVLTDKSSSCSYLCTSFSVACFTNMASSVTPEKKKHWTLSGDKELFRQRQKKRLRDSESVFARDKTYKENGVEPFLTKRLKPSLSLLLNENVPSENSTKMKQNKQHNKESVQHEFLKKMSSARSA